MIARVVLAGFVEGTRPYADRLKSVIEAGEQKASTLDAGEIEQAALEGARATLLAELARQVARSAKETGAAFERASNSLG